MARASATIKFQDASEKTLSLSPRKVLAVNDLEGQVIVVRGEARRDEQGNLIVLANEDARETQRRYELGSASRADALNAQSNAACTALRPRNQRLPWKTASTAVLVSTSSSVNVSSSGW